MKVNIAIPCYNEQNTIKECINNLENLGNEFQISIYNDGSSDETLPNIIDNQKIRVLSSKINYGLADVFNSIIYDSIQENFDYIIIFDADNQYPSDEIKLLLKTTIDNKLDICLGTRNFKNNKVFSKFKNLIQITGTKVISQFLGLKLNDVTTGFRCYSSKAFEDLFVMNKFSYTIESLFIAKKNKLIVGNYNLQKFFSTRESRLFKNNREYIFKTTKILFSSILLYRKKIIFYTYLISLLPGILLCSRFLLNYINNNGYQGNLQSLLLGTTLIVVTSIFYSLIMSFSYAKTNLREILVSNLKPKHTLLKRD